MAAVCALLPVSVHAAAWSADPSLELTSGANDNYGLAFDRTNRAGWASMTGGLVASRETENVATRLNASLTGLLLRGDLHQNEWQDSVALSHTLAGPVDSFAFNAKIAHDETLQAPTSSADLLIGRGLQVNASGDARWNRQVTERFSASSALAITRTRYSESLAGAHDYQNGSGSWSLRYLLDERDSVTADIVHQDYRTLDNGVRALTDSLTAGATRALTETANVSAAIGAYRSRTAVRQALLACPGSAVACVVPVVVEQVGHAARWGLQYNASFDDQVTELTRFGAAASRQQDPSGAGVTVLSDSLRVNVDRAVSETLKSSLSYTRSSSRYQGVAGGQQSRLQTVSALVSKALTPQLSLRAVVDYKRSTLAFDGLSAHSLGFAVTLRYEWQRFDAHL